MSISKKRIVAYFIDMLMIVIILFLLSSFATNKYQSYINDLNDSLIKEELSFSDYMDEYMVIKHEIDKANFGFNIFSLLLMVGFFIVIPFLNNGQTIGKKIMKIRMVKQNNSDLYIDDLIGRSIIVDGIGYLLTIIILVYLLPTKAYFYTITFLGIIQIMVVIVSGFMVLYRKDNLGIEDILTNTKLEEMK